MIQNQILGKRKWYICLMKALMILPATLACGLVLFLLAYVLIQGIPNITWELLSTKPSYLSGSIGILPDLFNTLSGIPSIIYGLVGTLFFCQFLNMHHQGGSVSVTVEAEREAC